LSAITRTGGTILKKDKPYTDPAVFSDSIRTISSIDLPNVSYEMDRDVNVLFSGNVLLLQNSSGCRKEFNFLLPQMSGPRKETPLKKTIILGPDSTQLIELDNLERYVTPPRNVVIE
jgi:hypothetical protein